LQVIVIYKNKNYFFGALKNAAMQWRAYTGLSVFCCAIPLCGLPNIDLTLTRRRNHEQQHPASTDVEEGVVR
jgi:hypothetical protein